MQSSNPSPVICLPDSPTSPEILHINRWQKCRITAGYFKSDVISQCTLYQIISDAYQVGPFQISLQGGWISPLLRPHRFSAGRRPKKIERLKGLGGERQPSAHAVGGRKEGGRVGFRLFRAEKRQSQETDGRAGSDRGGRLSLALHPPLPKAAAFRPHRRLLS